MFSYNLFAFAHFFIPCLSQEGSKERNGCCCSATGKHTQSESFSLAEKPWKRARRGRSNLAAILSSTYSTLTSIDRWQQTERWENEIIPLAVSALSSCSWQAASPGNISPFSSCCFQDIFNTFFMQFAEIDVLFICSYLLFVVVVVVVVLFSAFCSPAITFVFPRLISLLCLVHFFQGCCRFIVVFHLFFIVVLYLFIYSLSLFPLSTTFLRVNSFFIVFAAVFPHLHVSTWNRKGIKRKWWKQSLFSISFCFTFVSSLCYDLCTFYNKMYPFILHYLCSDLLFTVSSISSPIHLLSAQFFHLEKLFFFKDLYLNIFFGVSLLPCLPLFSFFFYRNSHIYL